MLLPLLKFKHHFSPLRKATGHEKLLVAFTLAQNPDDKAVAVLDFIDRRWRGAESSDGCRVYLSGWIKEPGHIEQRLRAVFNIIGHDFTGFYSGYLDG